MKNMKNKFKTSFNNLDFTFAFAGLNFEDYK